MSGKPASVAATRAGVAGAPRVLVYVAEARQLEPAAAGPEPSPQPPPELYAHDAHPSLPRSALYRQHLDQNDRTVYYKPYSDPQHKINSFEDNTGNSGNSGQREDFFPAQFIKESIRTDDKDRPSSVKSGDTEWSGDTYVRIPLGDFGYQRCPMSVDMPMLPVVNQFNDSVVQSDDMNCGDREVVGKSFVNYQLLEQSVSHQSIVNQSINILNQQVGVSRVSEDAPQLVRTADGVVLAVLPSVLSQSEELRTVSEFPQTIVVPLGWRRIVNGTSVLYVR